MTDIAIVVLLLGSVYLLIKAVAWGADMDRPSVHKGCKMRATRRLRQNHQHADRNDRQLRRMFRNEYRRYYQTECERQGF